MDIAAMRGISYLPRSIDRHIEHLLTVAGAVVIEGPRACGKTMTGLHHAQSAVFIDDEATQQHLTVEPGYALTGERPHLIDEWQLYPPLWNRVRRAVDASGGFGSFILTGSAVPADDTTRHTGAGRFIRIHQRTMTWEEKGQAQPRIHLTELFDGAEVAFDATTYSLADNLTALLTSGFPAHIRLRPADARDVLRGYIEEITHTDIYRMDDQQLRHDPVVVGQILRSIARLTADEARISTIRADIAPVAPKISENSVSTILSRFSRLHIVETVPDWTPRLRSRARLRTSGKLHHYRDSNGYELDGVLTLPDGRWGAVEVKLGVGDVPAAMERITDVVNQIDATEPPPSWPLSPEPVAPTLPPHPTVPWSPSPTSPSVCDSRRSSAQASGNPSTYAMSGSTYWAGMRPGCTRSGGGVNHSVSAGGWATSPSMSAVSFSTARLTSYGAHSVQLVDCTSTPTLRAIWANASSRA